ncbi:MAG: nucleotidyltransferase domain-containing protein [Gemmatimonadaceae bacterium]
MARLPSAESELLFERVCASGARPASRAHAQAVDWLAVAQLAERENLLGVLWPALASEQDVIPGEVAGLMRKQALVSEFRMVALEANLGRVVRLFNDHDIPVMLMKGAALAATRYGSFARRPMGDLDLLVRDGQVRQAWGLLRGAGWLPERDGMDAFYDEHQHLCPLIGPGGGHMVVELHRCLLYPHGPFLLAEADVWAAASRVDIHGRPAWVPSPEHLALHFCIHFAWSHQMRFGLGRTVRDLGVLSPVIDWDRLAEMARASRAESCCYWTLRLAATLGGVPVPSEVLASLAPRSPRWLGAALQRIVTAEALDLRQEFTPSLRLGRFAWSLAIRPRASGHGGSRPWQHREDFGKFAHGLPPLSFARRVRAQLGALPRWARFVAVAAGASTPPRARQ